MKKLIKKENHTTANFFKNITIKIIFLFIFMLGFNSCKKFLQIDPPKNAATTQQVFENDAIATSAITGVYSRMASSGAFSGDANGISILNGLSSDELKSHNTTLDFFLKNEVPSNNLQVNDLWGNAYVYIYTSNAILEGLKFSSAITETTQKQLQGEAKFIRAFCYFYLVNLFGEVPLNLTTDYRTNEKAGKASKDKIYSQIITDLTDAEDLLSDRYITNERVRPNKWAAKALLSRVFLYTQNWDLAAKKATEVIDQKTLYSLVEDLDKVFLKNSTEAIWQLMPTAGNNTQEGNLFILTSTPINVSLSPDLVFSFEMGDGRKVKWIGEFSNNTGKYYYPFKYKIKTTTAATGIVEYSMILRLAEMYLIRAEARAKLIHQDLALDDINVIRKRTGMVIPLVGLTQMQCLAEVEKQRRFELFSEWGHRWLDLKRTERANIVLEPLKGATWKNTDVLYPIPDNETSRNPNIDQNKGY